MQARTLVAVILSTLAGSIVYLVLIYLGSSTGPVATGGEFAVQALPAALASIMFVIFVLLPLQRSLQGGGTARIFLFLLMGSAAWLVLSMALLFLTTWDPKEGLRTASQFVVPGLVVVVVFGAIAKTG